MYCNNCGSKIENDAKFCGKCGHTITTTNTQEKIEGSENLKGLKGWLIIVLFGLLYMGYSYGTLAFSSIKYFTNGTVESLSGIQGYAAALGFEIVMQILLFLSIGYLIFLFSKKDAKFPKFFIVFAVINVIFIVLDTYIVASVLNYPTEEIKQIMKGLIQDSYTQLARSAAYAVVWIWYMKVSKRVALTFTEK